MIEIPISWFLIGLGMLVLAGAVLIWHTWRAWTAPTQIRLKPLETHQIGALLSTLSAWHAEQRQYNEARRWRRIAAQFLDSADDRATHVA